MLLTFIAIPVLFFSLGNYKFAAGSGLLAVFVAFSLYMVRKDTCKELDQRAALLFELGFETVEDDTARKQLLKLGKRRTKKAEFPYLARFRCAVDGVQVFATVQNCDVWATDREISPADALTLHAQVNPGIPGFRLGPPLAFAHRPLENFLRAPLSGFIDSSLEKSWYIYAGSAPSAELNLPRSLLDTPATNEYWTCEEGELRFTTFGELSHEQLRDAIAQLVIVAAHLNSL